MRYKVWQSDKNNYLHLLCEEGAEAFSALPAAIRHLGRPWTGSAEGDVNRLRLPYRSMLAEQCFVVIYVHVSKVQLEAVASVHALHRQTLNALSARGPRA